MSAKYMSIPELQKEIDNQRTRQVYNPSLTARLVLEPLARVHTLHVR